MKVKFHFIFLEYFSYFRKSFSLNNIKDEFEGKKINFNEDDELNSKNNNNMNKINYNIINNNNIINQRIHNSLLTNIEKENLILRNNKNNIKNNFINTKICCTCTKTNCLKKYCACYSNGKFCDECECINCMNTPKNKKEKEDENKNKKLIENNIICNCTKSNCLKKYCECYKMGKECGNLCRCIGCLNKININLNENENDKIINYNPYNKFMPHIICYNCPFITEYINISITNGIMKIIRNNSNNEEEIHKTPKLSNKKRMKENKNDSGNLNTCSSTINNSSRRKKKLCINKDVKTKKLLLN
jgi:hypothetical protein